MSASDLERRLSTFFTAASSEALPDGLLEDVYAVTRELPQRKGPAARRAAGVNAWWTNPFGIAPRLRILAVAALLLVALLIGLVYVAGHYRRLPPPYGPAANGRIVYDIDGKLNAIDLDGTTMTLPAPIGRSFGPVFSPDGTRLAYWSQGADATPMTLYVAGTDGSAPRRVSGSGGVIGQFLNTIAWSPDGRQIAYASADVGGGPSAIYVARSDGSGAERITPADGGDRTDPAWSPRGDLLAYELVRQGSTEAELAVVSPTGANEHTLVRSATASAGAFKESWFSPDGTMIAYERDLDGEEAVATVTLDGVETLRSDKGEFAGHPVWSNDGTRLLYAKGLYPDGMVVLDLRTGARTPVPVGLGDCYAYWSPDDTYLLGLGAHCGEVFRIPVSDPTAATRISTIEGQVNGGAGWQRIAP